MTTIGNKIIFKKVKKDKTITGSGLIIMTEEAVGEFVEADIIAVGKDVQNLKTGNKIMVKNGIGVNFEQDGIEYFQCIEDDIDCIVIE